MHWVCIYTVRYIEGYDTGLVFIVIARHIHKKTEQFLPPGSCDNGVKMDIVSIGKKTRAYSHIEYYEFAMICHDTPAFIIQWPTIV